MRRSNSTAHVLAFTPVNPIKPHLPQPTPEESVALREKWAGFELFLEELQTVAAPWIRKQRGRLTPEQREYLTGCLVTAFGFNDNGTPFHSLVVMERR